MFKNQNFPMAERINDKPRRRHTDRVSNRRRFVFLFVVASLIYIFLLSPPVDAAESKLILRYGVAMQMTQTEQYDPLGHVEVVYQRPQVNGTGLEVFARHESSIPDTDSKNDRNSYGIRGYLEF